MVTLLGKLDGQQGDRARCCYVTGEGRVMFLEHGAVARLEKEQRDRLLLNKEKGDEEKKREAG